MTEVTDVIFVFLKTNLLYIFFFNFFCADQFLNSCRCVFTLVTKNVSVQPGSNDSSQSSVVATLKDCSVLLCPESVINLWLC